MGCTGVRARSTARWLIRLDNASQMATDEHWATTDGHRRAVACRCGCRTASAGRHCTCAEAVHLGVARGPSRAIALPSAGSTREDRSGRAAARTGSRQFGSACQALSQSRRHGQRILCVVSTRPRMACATGRSHATGPRRGSLPAPQWGYLACSAHSHTHHPCACACAGCSPRGSAVTTRDRVAWCRR